MPMQSRITLSLIVLLVILSSCKSNPYVVKEIDAENPYQKDFLILADYIRKNHAGFYKTPLQTTSFHDYDELVATTAQKLKNISNASDFYYEIAPFITSLQDGHTRINTSVGKSMGIGAWWFNKKLVITSITDPSAADILYSEIVAISGKLVGDIEKVANQFIAADIGQDDYKKMYSPDLMLSNFLLLHLGLMNEREEVELTVVQNGEKRNITLGCTFPSASSAYAIPARFRNDTTEIKPGNTYAIIPDSNSLYVQLNSLPQSGYVEFWHEAFAFAQKNKAASLILDLRNNSGGNSFWCNEFLSYIIDKPRDLYVYDGWKSNYPHGNVQVSKGLWPMVPKNSELSFTGKIVVLTSRQTFSSATFFVVAIKDNDLGIIIGDQVGNGSIRYGFMSDPITLPYTKIKFATTHYIWARANKEMLAKEGASILPNIRVYETIEDLKSGTDPVYEKAIEYLK